MTIKVYRDCDARLRLRKVVVELYGQNGKLLDRTRMFAGPLLTPRLARRVARMKARGAVMARSSVQTV
jgi:hypothetical protein